MTDGTMMDTDERDVELKLLRVTVKSLRYALAEQACVVASLHMELAEDRKQLARLELIMAKRGKEEALAELDKEIELQKRT